MAFAGLSRSLVGRIGRQLVSVSVLDMATRLAAQAFLTALPMLFAVASFSPPAVREELRRTLRMLLGTAGSVFSQVEGVYAGGGDEARHTWGVVGLLLALVSATAFSRALQRLCERAWHLPRSGLRTVAWRWGVWLLAWVAALVFQGLLRSGFGAGPVLGVPLQLVGACLMWWWTQHLLLAGRVGWRPLLPGALLTGSGVVVFSVLSGLWLPRSLRLSVERYGPLGSVFTMLTWLIFFFATVVVGIAVGYVLAQDSTIARRLGVPRPVPGQASAEDGGALDGLDPTTRTGAADLNGADPTGPRGGRRRPCGPGCGRSR
ncbi:YihY/virulence factor BrkB family protein [Streptomyces sp. HD]|uniref:YihY/virulence factor BrkB family protein n=1 Tax=Streptomyces sp. HD TaxID=3020892 RepID=UPI002330FBD7|nr:YhjD/YihY/BrkB family envelope integrity protein [Streptomyces sp. HD]MDC0770561.1 YhjD/YihY/BrkB family envelope integrity protein [Streptomyces sp. HD]